MMTLEPCRPIEEHARLVMEWRNDPATCAASFHPRPKVWVSFWPTYRDGYFPPEVPGPVFAWEDGRRVAFLGFGPAEHPSDGTCRTADISINVAPPERGRGVGRRALVAALAHLKAAGFGAVLAEVREQNTASQKSFLAAGFTVLERTVKVIPGTGEACPIVRFLADLRL